MNEKEFLSIKYGERVINFALSYSDKRRRVGISVSPNCHVSVTAPVGVDKSEILSIVEDKCHWITKQLNQFNKIEFVSSHKDYKPGSSIKYFGEDLIFNVHEIDEGDEKIYISGNHLILKAKISNQERINLFVEEWLRQEALAFISKEFDNCYSVLEKHSIPRPSFLLRNMKNRWGSCLPSGVIYLNPSLIWLDKPLIKYVITHEICHLKFPNHSSDFYAFLDMVLPEWEFCEKRLEAF